MYPSKIWSPQRENFAGKNKALVTINKNPLGTLPIWQKKVYCTVQLQQLKLTQYKNYYIDHFTFEERVVGISGLNGVGKTNLLDAIHYLCFTKSYFTNSDNSNVQTGQQGFRLEGLFDKDGEAFKIACIFRGQNKKEIRCNDLEYEKFSQHIGLFPCVMIAPDDVELIIGGSESRRRWLDTLISQLDAHYLQQLIVYNKILQQRNSLLKQFTETRRVDNSLLDVLDAQLAPAGQAIFEERRVFLQALLPVIQQHYLDISGTEEYLQLQYDSQLLTQPFAEGLHQSRSRDLAAARTNVGIHKDDVVFLMQNEPFKQFASQGQRKSLLFALKLAEFDVLREHKGFSPILLLDDVFEKLDASRMGHLLEQVCAYTDAQLFITDTHKDRLQEALNELDVMHQIISL
jgi:DNA replication and repair protein RecF